MKRARRSSSSGYSEEAALSALVADESDLEEARARLSRIEGLLEDAKGSVRSLELAAFGTCVELVRATSRSDTDVGVNYEKRSVDASLTVGPKRYPFSITSDHEMGSILVESELFVWESENGDEGDFGEINDEDISAFLKKAHLQDAIKADRYKSFKNDALRRKKVYADIISKSIELVFDEVGETDDFGMEFGCGADDIYEFLGIKK